MNNLVPTKLLSVDVNILVLGVVEAESLPDEAKLKNDLLEYYDPSVRPIYNASTSTRVDCDIALQQIIDVVSLIVSNS